MNAEQKARLEFDYGVRREDALAHRKKRPLLCWLRGHEWLRSFHPARVSVNAALTPIDGWAWGRECSRCGVWGWEEEG